MSKQPSILATLVLVALHIPSAYGRSDTESQDGLYQAINEVMDDFQQDLPGLAETGSKKVVLTRVDVHGELGEEVEEYLTHAIQAAGTKNKSVSIVNCIECSNVRAEMIGDEIFVKKGITDAQDLEKLVKPTGAKHYAEASARRAGKQLLVAMNVMSIQDGAVVWQNNYRETIVDNDRSGMRFFVTMAQGMVTEGGGYPVSISTGVAQRLGFGEFGLGLFGSTAHGKTAKYGAAGPLARLSMSRIFGLHWNWGDVLLGSKVHFGWYDGKYRDLLLSGGLKIEIGRLYHVTFDYYRGVTLESEEKRQEIANKMTEDKLRVAYPTSFAFGFGMDV